MIHNKKKIFTIGIERNSDKWFPLFVLYTAEGHNYKVLNPIENWIAPITPLISLFTFPTIEYTTARGGLAR